MKSNCEEQVLVFPTTLLDPYLEDFASAGGIITDRHLRDEIIARVMEKKNLSFLPRSEAETDPTHQQLIPYCVLTYQGEVFAYQRTKKAGESRLRGKWSVGVGGHINPVDAKGKSPYEAGLRRELYEEVRLSFPAHHRFPVLGLIADRSTEVGRVHFGIVHQVEVDLHEVSMEFGEELGDGQFFSVKDLVQLTPDLETWSKLVMEHADLV